MAKETNNKGNTMDNKETEKEKKEKEKEKKAMRSKGARYTALTSPGCRHLCWRDGLFFLMKTSLAWVWEDAADSFFLSFLLTDVFSSILGPSWAQMTTNVIWALGKSFYNFFYYYC